MGKATQSVAASVEIEFHRGLGRTAHGLLLVTTVVVAVDQLGLNITVVTIAIAGLALASGLVLGAIAVATALAFALGGREVAAREPEEWLKSVKSEES